MSNLAPTTTAEACVSEPAGAPTLEALPGLLEGSLGFAGEESAGASFLCLDGTVWVTDKDGLITQHGWCAARPSGTEAVYKLCAESFKGHDHLRRIQEEAPAAIQRAFRTKAAR